MASPQDWSANLTTIVTNVTVLATFAGIVAAGILEGRKRVKDFRKPDGGESSQGAQIAAATILENVTLNDWSTSNREVVASNHRLELAIERLSDNLTKNRDEFGELRFGIRDLIHALKERG